MGLHPDVTAGLSLGEYCAIEAKQAAWSFVDAITTVRKKRNPDGTGSSGRKRKHGGSYGMETEKIEEVIADISDVSIANYNCPGQIVITGLAEAVAEASEKLKSAGARRVIPLNVSGPFHSAMLITAGKELGKVLEGITLHQLKIPYVTNVTAEYVEDPSETKSTSGKTDLIFRALAAECGKHDPPGSGYLRGDRTWKNTGRVYEKDRQKCKGI